MIFHMNDSSHHEAFKTQYLILGSEENLSSMMFHLHNLPINLVFCWRNIHLKSPSHHIIQQNDHMCSSKCPTLDPCSCSIGEPTIFPTVLFKQPNHILYIYIYIHPLYIYFYTYTRYIQRYLKYSPGCLSGGPSHIVLLQGSVRRRAAKPQGVPWVRSRPPAVPAPAASWYRPKPPAGRAPNHGRPRRGGSHS